VNGNKGQSNLAKGDNRMQKKSCRYLLPFEHSARTWQTDRQTDIQTYIQTRQNGNSDTSRWNCFQQCRL